MRFSACCGCAARETAEHRLQGGTWGMQTPLVCDVTDCVAWAPGAPMVTVPVCRVSASVQGQEQLSHTHRYDAQSDSFIIPLVQLYTFSISVHVITLIRIGYRHKSRAVHAPHIPL